MTEYIRKTPPPSVYVGKVGFYRVSTPLTKESPMWVPVRVVAAHEAYNRVDLVVEPVGGYGSIRLSTTTVWFKDDQLNRAKYGPTAL